MIPEEQVQALAKAMGEHYWDMTDEIKIDGVWTWVVCCECGEMPPMVDGHKHIVEAMLASPAFRAILADAWDEGHRTHPKLGPDDCLCGAWSDSECGCGIYGSNVITPNPYRTDRETS